jgi:hypothetical protein
VSFTKYGEKSLKPNWVCTECGMYSSRRYNVRRHVDSIHSGVGNMITFLEYLTGVKLGEYKVQTQPQYQTKQNVKSSSRIFAEEYYRELARRLVDKAPKALNNLCLNSVLNSIE